MALAMHELATNAMKYGALAQAGARLDIVWRECRAGGRRWIVLDWSEHGVAMPDSGGPKRKGYGSELIERALPYQLQAKTRLDFAADGVRCTIAVPLQTAKGATP
jgi:two-component sensor histidine kinase